MNESYLKLAKAIAKPRYNGQIDDIRRLSRCLELPTGSYASGLIVLLVGVICGIPVTLFIGWLIWG